MFIEMNIQNNLFYTKCGESNEKDIRCYLELEKFDHIYDFRNDLSTFPYIFERHLKSLIFPLDVGGQITFMDILLHFEMACHYFFVQQISSWPFRYGKQRLTCHYTC
jgi:hypothetical protein